MVMDKQKAGGCRKPPGHVRGTSMQLTAKEYRITEIEAIPDGDYLDQLISESVKGRCLCTTPCLVCRCSAEGGASNECKLSQRCR